MSTAHLDCLVEKITTLTITGKTKDLSLPPNQAQATPQELKTSAGSAFVATTRVNEGSQEASAFEEGSETMSKEANTQLALRQEKFIRDLKNALVRIENKTYGVCRVTGKLIDKKRLNIVPHATLSIEAKNIQN